MTVASETNRSGPYSGNGVTTVFSYGFRILDEDHIRVIKTSALGVETVLTIATDYTVSGVGNPAGGSVTLLSAPATGETVTLLRAVPFVQETDLENQGAYYAETVEDALDLAAMRDQQLAEELDRALRIPASSSAVDLQLPTPEAGKIISWNETASGLQNLSPAELSSVVAYGTANSDIFTGDGVTTVFSLSANPAALNNLDVAIGGVTQLPGVDYNWSSGTNITFTTAPANGVKVLVRYMQALAQGSTQDDLVASDDGASGTLWTTVAGFIAYLRSFYGTLAIGWRAAGLGAVLRTLWAKLMDLPVSVKDFGAVGDGTTDDTAAIQAAINAASTVLFPSGPSGTTYRITSTLTVPANKTLIGDNSWLSIIQTDDLDAPIFQATSVANVNITNLHLRYNGTPVSGGDAIRLTSCQTCRLQNLWISNSWNGVSLVSCGNIELHSFWNYEYENCGLLLNASINTTLSNFLFEAGNSARGLLGGIRLYGGCEQFLATNGGVQRGIYGITTANSGSFARGSAPYFNRFANVFFDSNKTAGALLRDTAFTDFTGCWFSSAGYDQAGGGYSSMLDSNGIDISSCSDITFTGGEANANGGRAALIYPSGVRIRFVGTRFWQNQKTRSSDGAAIEVLANGSDFSVTNCTFYRDPDTTTYRQLNAVVVNAGTSDRYIVADNLLGGCSVFDGGSGANKRIANNY